MILVSEFNQKDIEGFDNVCIHTNNVQENKDTDDDMKNMITMDTRF